MTNLEAVQVGVEDVSAFDVGVESHGKLKIALCSDVHHVVYVYAHPIHTCTKYTVNC